MSTARKLGVAEGLHCQETGIASVQTMTLLALKVECAVEAQFVEVDLRRLVVRYNDVYKCFSHTLLIATLPAIRANKGNLTPIVHLFRAIDFELQL